MRTLLILCAICLPIWPDQTQAEEQVTLKSGARLIGDVSLAGQMVNVKIGDSKLEIPLNEVDLIGPVGTQPKQSPERLLMIALEARAQQGTSAGQVGLLGEAYRMSPRDPRIGYWFAHSLLDAGFGTPASEVLRSNHQAIERAYPGMTASLVQKIGERIRLESLPPDLIKQIERIGAAAGNAPLRSDRVPMFVRFRLTDSTGQPIEKSAVRVSCNGNDEQLEGYEGGHYLFMFNSYRNNEEPVCQLNVNSPGLESKQFEICPAADQVANAGDFVVKRFSDDEKVPLTIIVADHAGQRVEKASVILRPEGRGDDNASQTATTDADGRAQFKAFPMKYGYTVTAKGLKSESGGVELKPASTDQNEQRVELYPIIAATIRFAWSTTSLQGNSETTTNEATIKVGEGIPPMPYSPDTMNFLRPVQDGDKLTLQSGPPYFGGPMAAAMTTWVRQVPEELLKDSPLEYFTGIDLTKLDKLQEEFRPIKTDSASPRGPYPQISFALKQGEVYVGKLTGRDMRSGQPTVVSFKVFIEELSTKGGAD